MFSIVLKPIFGTRSIYQDYYIS